MFANLSILDLLLLAALAIVAVALIARRTPALQAKLLDVLPDAGDKLLLAMQQQLPGRADLRETFRQQLDAIEAKEEAIAKAYLEKRGWVVARSAQP